MVENRPPNGGPGFDSYTEHRVVSFGQGHFSPEYCLILRKRWLRPDMIEKCWHVQHKPNTKKQTVSCLYARAGGILISFKMHPYMQAFIQKLFQCRYMSH